MIVVSFEPADDKTTRVPLDVPMEYIPFPGDFYVDTDGNHEPVESYRVIRRFFVGANRAVLTVRQESL